MENSSDSNDPAVNPSLIPIKLWDKCLEHSLKMMGIFADQLRTVQSPKRRKKLEQKYNMWREAYTKIKAEYDKGRDNDAV